MEKDPGEQTDAVGELKGMSVAEDLPDLSL